MISVVVTLLNASSSAMLNTEEDYFNEISKKFLDCRFHDANVCVNGDLTASEAVGTKTRKEVTAFVKASDRITAMVSTALKSMAFLEVYSELKPTLSSSIVVLPRTEYRKPFIPSRNGESSCHPFSISHQWPFVGLVSAEPGSSTVSSVLLGLDLVVFEPFNPSIYNSNREFVDVFRDSFDPTEWTYILKAGDNLRELYLRWAVKEAYTKALGVGLGFNFAAFQVVWDEPVSTLGLWHTLETRASKEALNLCGVIAKHASDNDTNYSGPSKETWQFSFTPLFTEDESECIGAACACARNHSFDSLSVSVKWQWKWTDVSSIFPV